jgi:ABC-2 type transport system permease protein
MLGKFFAAWVFIGLSLVLTFPIVITVFYLGQPDPGVILAGYFGSFLMAGAFLAIGCCLSACTSNQVISFVLSTFVCLIFILIGSDPVVRLFEGILTPSLLSQLVNLSFPFHFEAIQRGVINITDLVYFVSVMVIFLYAGIIILERKKAD